MPGKNDKGMFVKFTKRSRHVVQLAQEEAQQLNHNYVGTEHLLLGLLRESDGVAAKVLVRMGVQLGNVRHSVEHVIGRGDHIVLGEIGLTPRSKKVFELSVDEAHRLGHQFVGTEHLLLGLLREGEGIAAGVLESHGIALDHVRKEVLETLKDQQLANEDEETDDDLDADVGAGPKANVITCRIDNRDLDALDALVEAGIRSTRSDAAAWLIHSGIEAQHDLLDRVYAAVAQIRQLRAEARSLAQDIRALSSNTNNKATSNTQTQEKPETEDGDDASQEPL